MTDDAEDRGPEIGEVLVDSARARVGRVMGHEGPFLQIRPLAGGVAWDAEPRHVRLLDQDELLSALVAEANARSRRSTC
ncbi:hypothetical protein ABZ341_25335 [Streptomyces sp. NPDC006173]|uniref:hypothetical protein n=1 Tax=Streptomyces sp. NPDC006173 TaxID=3155349 RepID=UPI0034028F57